MTALVLIVMGVSGAGKSTLAEGLRDRLGWRFQEGDDLHPQANRQKMASGQPLTDKDRAPWLELVKAWIDSCLAEQACGLITCSALKRIYRARLVDGRPSVRLLYLKAERAVLEQRLLTRRHDFMPASLLHSQLETLEEPGSDEAPLVVQMAGDTASTLARAMREVSGVLQERAGPSSGWVA